jgi:hypothetical protein
VAIDTSQAGGEKRQILIAVALLVLIVLAGYISYSKFMPHRQVVTYPDTPDIKWMKQKALECKGDPRNLSPEDQQKLHKIAGAYYGMVMPRYYKDQGGKMEDAPGGPGAGGPRP